MRTSGITGAGVRRICLAGLIGLVLTAMSGISVYAAEAVSVRAGVHPGYGRIVFDWPRGVGFSASISNRMLNVRFDRPLEPDFGTVRRTLRTFLRDIRLASDGRTVLAGLSADYDVKAITSGNRVVVDLIPTEAKPEAGRQSNTPPGPIAPRAVAPPIRLGPQAARQSASTTSNPVDATARQSAGDVIRVRTGHRRNYGRLVFDWPRKVGFTVDRKGQTVRLRFEAPGRVDAAALRNNLPSQISAVLARPSAGKLELSMVVAPDSQLRYFHNGSSVVFDVVAPGVVRDIAKTRKAPVTTETKSAAKGSTREKTRNGKKRKQARGLDLVSVDARRQGSEVVIRFNWRSPVGAAVFHRNGALWIVFDRAARVDLGAIKVVGSALFQSVDQVIGKDNVQIKLPFGAGLNASVRQEGTIWILSAGARSKSPPKALQIDVRRSPEFGTEFLVKTPETGPILISRDTAVGDAAYAVPLKTPGIGLPAPHRFAEFELASSPQGLAIKTLDDAVRVRADKDGIVIFRKGGLTISPDFVRQAKLADGTRAARLLDLAAWRYGPDEDFQKVEHQLLEFLAKPKGVQRNAARIGLARFYLAHGLGSEALGVIGSLLREDPGLIRDPSIRAMRGMANYLIRHFPEAKEDLGHPSLAGVRELYPWRAAIAAAKGDWAGAKRLFNDTDSVIAGLPPQFSIHLGIIAAEAALSVNDTASAEARLSSLEGLSARSSELDSIAYLKGHVHKQRKRPEKALGMWQSVMRYGDRPSRAKAAFSTVNLKLDAGTITKEQATEELEKLKFAWRNSVFEFDLLHKLGDLYASRDMLRDALVTLRKAASLYRDINGSQTLTEKMRTLFRSFYLDGKADRLRPVVALGLYNEFRELTPPGQDGDLMTRKLAERLVKVDLLEDASKLYEHQVRFRTKGPQKAELGIRLAELRLMDRDPESALHALDISKVEKTDAALMERRRYLRARALSEARRGADALKVIAQDFSDRFDLLRAEIHWRAGEWYKASRTLALISSQYDPASLGNQEVEILLRRAVALGLAGDREGMNFLRERYGAAMERSPRGTAFKAVAGGVPRDVADFASLARQAAELGTFRGFLEGLNPKPGTPGNAAATGAGGAS